MDYGQGQSNQPGQSVPLDFFTTGAGTNDERINNFEPENNLDLTNSQTDWRPQSSLQSNQQLGQQAMHSIESQPRSQSANSAPRLGEVVPLDMPPAMENAPLVMVNGQNSLDPVQVTPISEPTQDKQPNIPTEHSIKTSDTLNKEGIKLMDDAIDEFKQDENVVDFYNFVRDGMETNLEKSYDRKLAA